jgi:hypothetical protein
LDGSDGFDSVGRFCTIIGVIVAESELSCCVAAESAELAETSEGVAEINNVGIGVWLGI